MPVPAVTELPVSTESQHVMGQMWAAVAVVHAQEAEYLRELRRVRDLEGYRVILARLYGFQRRAEEMICTVDWTEAGIDPRLMCRAASLRVDLAALGMNERACEELPVCELAPIKTLPQAIGVAFVLLGSVAGAPTMATWISEALPQPPLSFFRDGGR